MIFPIYWMVVGSFRKVTIASSFEWFPSRPVIDNYIVLLTKELGVNWTINSIFVSAVAVVIALITCSLAGYVLAKKKFPGGTLLFWVFLSTMMIPREVFLVPLYILIRNMGLDDSLWAAILPLGACPMGVFLLKQYMSSLPNELIEAAVIDGCNEYRIFSNIIIPISKPAIGALAIFVFMSSWNDYFWQLIVLRSSKIQTLNIGLTSLMEFRTTEYGLLMAGAVVAAVPMFIIFFCFQKYFISGITIGAVKG